MLNCPAIESYEWDDQSTGIPTEVKYLCDREATYQIDGIVYCMVHAKRLMFDAEKHRNPELAFCSNPDCSDGWYIPLRKPRSDQLNYCRTCGKSSAAERLRKRRQRAKAEMEDQNPKLLNVKIRQFLEKRI